MRLVVTGGLGFIGSNFIGYWFSKHPKDTIVNIDKMTYAANPENLKGLVEKHNYEFVKADISDKDAMLRAVKGSDAVINFAAESHVDRSISDPHAFIKSNIVGVYSMLEAIKKYGIRFHHVSTDEVFGSLPLDSKEKFNENSRYAPRNPYSASKASGDHLVNAYFNTYGVPVTISNCGNNYGPNQHSEKLIPKTILNAIKGEKITVYGNGMQVRDWIYVEDHCRALEIILNKGEIGQAYLVSAGQERRNMDVIKAILKRMGRGEEMIVHVKDRQGHDARYALDASKIMSELGWMPKTSFDRGLELTIEHYKNNTGKYSR